MFWMIGVVSGAVGWVIDFLIIYLSSSFSLRKSICLCWWSLASVICYRSNYVCCFGYRGNDSFKFGIAGGGAWSLVIMAFMGGAATTLVIFGIKGFSSTGSLSGSWNIIFLLLSGGGTTTGFSTAIVVGTIFGGLRSIVALASFAPYLIDTICCLPWLCLAIEFSYSGIWALFLSFY